MFSLGLGTFSLLQLYFFGSYFLQSPRKQFSESEGSVDLLLKAECQPEYLQL